MKFYISLYLAKFIYLVSKNFKLGSGFTWPGHVALKIYPQILKDLRINYPRGVVIVTGTNGKTTTSKIISHILTDKGFCVLNNSSGANLKNGIVSSVLLNKDFLGRSKADIAVFEVDEMHLAGVVKDITPDFILLLNLSRDQLDRYGEIDYILDSWLGLLPTLPETCRILVDPEEGVFSKFANLCSGKLGYFMEDSALIEGTVLSGKHNAKNAAAALSVVENFGISRQDFIQSLQHFEYAYGRGEAVFFCGCKFIIFLAKNPSSFNNNLSLTVGSLIDCSSVFIVFNDNIPDGRDVSWIYDIDSALLLDSLRDKRVFVSGKRCMDMAVRLEYAGINVDRGDVNLDTRYLVKKICEEGLERVLVLPNYSAMLDFRKIVLGKRIL